MAQHDTEQAKHRQGGPGKAARRSDGKGNDEHQQQSENADRHGVGKGGAGNSTNRRDAPG